MRFLRGKTQSHTVDSRERRTAAMENRHMGLLDSDSCSQDPPMGLFVGEAIIAPRLVGVYRVEDVGCGKLNSNARLHNTMS